MDHLTNDYIDKLPSLKAEYSGVSDEVLMAMQHFLGLTDTKLYLSVYRSTLRSGSSESQAHAAAQKAVQTGVPNSTVQDYLNTFLKAYNR